jgi:hypothetical protein
MLNASPVSNLTNLSLPPDENAVVTAISKHLVSSGFEIKQQLSTTEHGIDVIAQHPESKVRALVEAKGGTSSRKGSERYGKPYTQSQVFDRVAKGIFTCLQLRSSNPNKNSVRIILAVPDRPPQFKKYLSEVLENLKASGIEVWFASEELL